RRARHGGELAHVPDDCAHLDLCRVALQGRQAGGVTPMAKFARIAITNVHAGGDYTGQIQVGPDKRTMNVLLDTGSSQLALDARRYHRAPTDRTTHFAQQCNYSDGSSWTGAVIRTTVSAGAWGEPVVLR